jgi:hypothetical protein
MDSRRAAGTGEVGHHWAQSLLADLTFITSGDGRMGSKSRFGIIVILDGD